VRAGDQEGAEDPHHGEVLVRAVLYARVSTEEQGNKGYSLRQQLEALRSYCKDHNIEIIAEFEDRASGASLDRPGLNALRDVVSSGAIDLVLTQDRDRLSREPAHIYILREEFLGYGTTLRSLNDRGDDSPEGQLTDGILDQLAKFERAKTMERTRRGKLRKAQEGKIVGTGTPPYGFYYSENHYHVDPERMPYVHEMFERAAAGDSLYSIVQYLTKVGAPTPKCGRWHASTVRNILQSDTYSGNFYWNKNRVITTTVSKVENGERTYKKKVVTERRSKEDWIAIPVPDSGIPAETISRARESLKGNTKSVSKNGSRTWELSGGVSLCSECSRHMVAYTIRNSAKKAYHYYRCSNREHHACSNRRNYPAQGLEMQIKGALEETFQPETWSGYVNDICERRLSDLHKLHRPNAKGNLLSRVSDLEMQMSRARHLFIKGDLPHPEYEENKTTLQDQIEVVQKDLSKVENLDVEIECVEKLRRTLMSIEDPLSGHYAFIIDEESDIDLLGNENDFKYGFGYGSRKLAAKRRQEFYRRSGLTVRVGEELEISLGVGEPIVSKLNTASASNSGSTSY
jgi:site-specific DNA recombinase